MEKVVSKDGTSIAYTISGHGPSLILVDGAFCYRSYGVTPKLAPYLNNYFTVYSYDRRGRGESEDNSLYRVEKEIDDLSCVVNLTRDVPFLFGMSSGAALVLQAMAAGIKVEKIAMFEPPYFANPVRKDEIPLEAENVLKELIKVGKRSEAVKYFMVRVMGMPSIAVLLLKLFGVSIWNKNKAVANTLAYDLAIMGNYSVPRNITNNIPIPTLVIAGEKSSDTIQIAAREIATSAPKGQLRILKGQNHNIDMKFLAPVLIEYFFQIV